MLFETLFARVGEMWTITLAGGVIGVLFGFFAHRSRFCMRSAVIEFARGTREGRLTVWLSIVCVVAVAGVGTVHVG